MNAIYGALAAGAIILLANGLRSQPVEAEACQEAGDTLRDDLQKTRLEFVEFRAEAGVELKSLRSELEELRRQLKERH
jgi:hypothetical protein